MSKDLTFYEFFAGGGLARVGLGPDWQCLFANDISEKKAHTYRRNFDHAPELAVKSIHDVMPTDVPGRALLAWASFPCQDLSLAGNGGGLRAARSGTFWPFWTLLTALDQAQRGVPIIVLENVVGLLTASKGQDFQELLTVLVEAGYRPGVLVMDAIHFVPQSRPRLFIVAIKNTLDIPEDLVTWVPTAGPWHPSSLLKAHAALPRSIQDAWIWWKLAPPPAQTTTLRDLVEAEPQGVAWHTQAETEYLLSLMSPVNLAKVRQMQSSGQLEIGTIYKRMRVEDGIKRQRAEVRADGISGCLRTPTGGSSRQIIIAVEGTTIRTRLLSVREAARLMGLPEHYQLPASYNDGYHVMGDAVAVPVVSWLETQLLRPLASASTTFMSEDSEQLVVAGESI